MAANLYARSIFGEDALANVSIEKPSDQSGPSVTGHVRIRAKSQVNDVCHVLLPPSPHGDYSDVKKEEDTQVGILFSKNQTDIISIT